MESGEKAITPNRTGPKCLPLVTPARFERATFPLGGGRSIQLSYGAWKRCEGYSVMTDAAIPLGRRTRRAGASPLSFRAHTAPSIAHHGFIVLESPVIAWRQPIAAAGGRHIDAGRLLGRQDAVSPLGLGTWRCRRHRPGEQAGVPGNGHWPGLPAVHRLQWPRRIFRRCLARNTGKRCSRAIVGGSSGAVWRGARWPGGSIQTAPAYPLLGRGHLWLAAGHTGSGVGAARHDGRRRSAPLLVRSRPGCRRCHHRCSLEPAAPHAAASGDGSSAPLTL